MAYNLRSRGPVEDVPEDLDMSDDEGTEGSDEEGSEEGSDVESDPFYGPFLENELLMNIGRIMRYELSRNIEVHFHQVQADEDEDGDDDEPPPTTRVAPDEELPTDDVPPLLPDVPPPPVPVPVEAEACDSTKLSASDFEGLARYRLTLIAVRHFEHTGIRNVYIASSMPNAELLARLCQIPRGVAAEDCSICNFPLWDFTKLRCCGNNLCVHCMYRCTECPYCRSTDGF
jgi:hypothetical protein